MAARKFPIIFAVLLAVSVGVTAARVGVAPAGAATDGSVVLAWNQQVLDAIVATKTGPTIAARALAVVHTAIYDAWAAYDAVAVPTIANGNGRRPPAERTLDNKDKAVSFAAYAALVDLFPTQQDAFYRQMTTTLGYDPAAASPDATTPEGVGTLAARAVLAFRHQDGANQLGGEPGTPDAQVGTPYADYTGYTSANSWDKPLEEIDPDHWQPLCVLTDAGVKNGMPPTPPAGKTCDPPNYKKQTFLTPTGTTSPRSR